MSSVADLRMENCPPPFLLSCERNIFGHCCKNKIDLNS